MATQEHFDESTTLLFLTSKNQRKEPTATLDRTMVISRDQPVSLIGLYRVAPTYELQRSPPVRSVRHVETTHVGEAYRPAEHVVPEEYWADTFELAQLVNGGCVIVNDDPLDNGPVSLLVDISSMGRVTFAFEHVTPPMTALPAGYTRRDENQVSVEAVRWAIESETEDPAPLIRSNKVPNKLPGSLSLRFDEFMAKDVAGRMTMEADYGEGYVLIAQVYSNGAVRIKATRLRE